MCSQIVFFFFVFLCLFQFCIFAQNIIKIEVKNSKVKNWSKLKLKTGPSMLRNKIGPVFNARDGSFFVSFFFFLKNPLLSAGRMRFSKIKMDQFLT